MALLQSELASVTAVSAFGHHQASFHLQVHVHAILKETVFWEVLKKWLKWAPRLVLPPLHRSIISEVFHGQDRVPRYPGEEALGCLPRESPSHQRAPAVRQALHFAPRLMAGVSVVHPRPR